MKKRNNFFQLFSFSYILQGFHGEKNGNQLGKHDESQHKTPANRLF